MEENQVQMEMEEVLLFCLQKNVDDKNRKYKNISFKNNKNLVKFN